MKRYLKGKKEWYKKRRIVELKAKVTEEGKKRRALKRNKERINEMN